MLMTFSRLRFIFSSCVSQGTFHVVIVVSIFHPISIIHTLLESVQSPGNIYHLFQIVNAVTGQELGKNTPGEVWIRGPQVFNGYLNLPEQTKQMLHEDGWIKTGIEIYSTSSKQNKTT